MITSLTLIITRMIKNKSLSLSMMKMMIYQSSRPRTLTGLQVTRTALQFFQKSIFLTSIKSSKISKNNSSNEPLFFKN